MSKATEFYDSYYGDFAAQVHAAIRQETYSEDIGQNGWLTADEHDMLISWLALSSGGRFLDVACGAGQPTLRICEETGAFGVGIDVNTEGIARATEVRDERGMQDLADFQVVDGSLALPFEDESFDALVCIDAINHLPDRPAVLRQWHKALKPGGRLVFIDPIVITGAISNAEIAIRSSVGFFLFVAPDEDERLLSEAGFTVTQKEDRTENMATTARNWHAARAKHRDELIKLEGEDTYEDLQTFFDTAATLAEEKRLSRFAFRAVKA